MHSSVIRTSGDVHGRRHTQTDMLITIPVLICSIRGGVSAGASGGGGGPGRMGPAIYERA